MKFIMFVGCVVLAVLAVARADLGDSVARVLMDGEGAVGSNQTNYTLFPFIRDFEYVRNGTIGKLETISGFEERIELENQLKGKECMRNLSKCMHEDTEFEPTMKQLTKFLFASSPPFDLSNIEGVSEDCRLASEIYIEDLNAYHVWALQMYDATAKIPSGFLSGNINQLGDFDLCLAAVNRQQDIYGKYCLPSLQIETPHSPYLSGVHDRVYAHQSFKSKLGDPGHRVPRYSSINWALCVPSQCTSKDVEIGFRRTVDNILSSTDLEYKMEMDSNMCSTNKPKDSRNYGFVFGSLFFATAILIAFAATVYDWFAMAESKNEVIMAFSLRKNFNSMVNTQRQPNDLEAVHGIRFLNALMLILSHKSMALLFLPYVNRTEMSEIIGQPWTVLGRAASLYTDPFIMLSGTLTAYSLFGRLQKGIKINILEEYASRLLRIVPTLGALILFCTFVLPYISAGPMWNLVVTHHSDICKSYWWRNLLFIHNYFGFKDMCLTHTHHVGIDTQLFFVSPFMVLLLWKWPKRGVVTLSTIAVISTIMRYYVTYTMNLSNYIHFGTSVQQLFNTADYMYILPPHRVTVYVMGIFLAYVLRMYKNLILKPAVLHLGNIIAIASFLVSFVGPSFMGSIDYVYQPAHAAWYAAFAPILWCVSFAWVIFTCHLGYKSTAGQFFCLPLFRIWTKISYTVYLTQFPIFFYNVGTTRHSEYYSFVSKNLNIMELIWIIGLSAALTLLFETPFQNLKNIMFRKKRATVKTPEMPKKKIS